MDNQNQNAVNSVEEKDVVTPTEQEIKEVVEPALEEVKLEEKPEEKEEEKPTEEELKKKLSASARENQKILAKNRKIAQAIAESTGITPPTEEELAQEFDDWDIMSDSERKIATDTVINRKWRENIAKAQTESENIEKWGEEVVKFVDDPQTLLDNPDLEGKQDDFKEFATADENKNVPFKILVGAFLYDNKSKKVEHKGQMFPTGQGGDKEKPIRTDGKISFEEGEKLKVSNYQKWKELNSADKIADPEL